MIRSCFAACLLACAVFSGCSRPDQAGKVKADSRPADPTKVRVAEARAINIEKAILVTGSLLADETVTISSEVQGRVQSIRFDFGQSVRKGDVIAQLDSRDQSLQLERSKASLAQALARIGLTPGQESKPPQSTPAIRQVEAQAADARSKFESARKLVKTGDIAEERFTELEKAYNARQAGVDAARDELRTQWASIQALQAEVRLAEKKLNDATLIAPFDGVVGDRYVSPGQFIKENTAVLTLVKTHPLRLRLEVPESAAGAVRIGTPLSFSTDAVPGVQFKAIVRELHPSLDAKARSLTAEARLTSAEPRLRPGMFAQIRLVTVASSPVVAIPKQSLYSIAGLTKAFIIRDGKAKELRFVPGQEIGDLVEVPGSLLQPGEHVAVSNMHLLTDGSKVSE